MQIIIDSTDLKNAKVTAAVIAMLGAAPAKVKKEEEAEEDLEESLEEEETEGDDDITLDMLRKKVQVKVKAGKEEKVRALLTSLKAKNLSLLKEEHYPKFLAGLEKIK